MKIEVGKKYRNRNGNIWVVVSTSAPGPQPVIAYRDGVIANKSVRVDSFCSDGAYFKHMIYPYGEDLVEEYIEPKIHKDRVALFRNVCGPNYWISQDYAKKYGPTYKEELRLTDWVEVQAEERKI